MKQFTLILAMMMLFLASCSSDDSTVSPSPSSSSSSSSDSTLDTNKIDTTKIDTNKIDTNSIEVLPAPNYPNTIPANADITPFEINKMIGKGMNLGNALEAKGGEGAWGVTLKEVYFKMLADSGFQSVRVPIRWNDLTADSIPYTIDSALVARVDWVIDNALKNGLMVIINQHHFDALYSDVEGQKGKFLAIWKFLATRYQNYPQNLVFEILNEPREKASGATWYALQEEALSVIRETNPKRKVIVTGDGFGGYGGLLKLPLPKDNNLIATFHYYEPFNFTHQGAEWVDGADAWLGNTWEGTFIETSSILEIFSKVDQYSKDNNIPIFVGEFGAYSKADSLSRFLWTQYTQNMIEHFEFSSAYWEFCSGFGVYNDPLDKWNISLMSALLRNNGIVDTTKAEDRPLDSTFLLLDDFENSLGDISLNNNIFAMRAKAKGLPTDTVGGWWYVYCNTTSTCIAPTGDTLIQPMIIDTLIVQKNIDSLRDKLFGDFGNNGSKGINAIFNLKGDDYPYLGVGTNLVDKDNGEKWVDLKNLSAISFWAKGYGNMRLAIETDTVKQLGDWGQFGKEFVLTNEWKEYKIFADQIAPKPWSKTEEYGVKWSDACHKSTEFQFTNDQSYGISCDDSINIYIDDIKLHGLTTEDFGF